jgi:hypothetical protein
MRDFGRRLTMWQKDVQVPGFMAIGVMWTHRLPPQKERVESRKSSQINQRAFE